MTFFRWCLRRDPKITYLRPYVDPRKFEDVAKQVESEVMREWRRRLAENAAKRQSKKVDEIAQEYAERLPPFQIQAGMQA
jgi:hypothetical protein